MLLLNRQCLPFPQHGCMLALPHELKHHRPKSYTYKICYKHFKGFIAHKYEHLSLNSPKSKPFLKKQVFRHYKTFFFKFIRISCGFILAYLLNCFIIKCKGLLWFIAVVSSPHKPDETSDKPHNYSSLMFIFIPV